MASYSQFAHFINSPKSSPVGTAIWLIPPGAMGHLRKHTEIRATTDHSCQPNGSRPFKAADRWLGRLLHWFTSIRSLGSFRSQDHTTAICRGV